MSEARRRILVTGATGNVGREVVRALHAKGIPVRVGDRQPARAQAAHGDVGVVALDYGRPETFARAVEGARGLFLMRPPAISNVRDTLLPLVDAAAARGVEQVVFLSVAEADANRLIPHHAVEAHLRTTHLAWTMLRPGFFAQNLGDAYRRDVAEDDRLYVPAGDGAAVTFAEAAATLSSALARSIEYVPASVLGYARHLRSRGMPLAQIAVQTVLHVGLRFGQGAAVDPTLGAILGRAPRTLADYVRDHARLWRRSSPGSMA